MRSGWALAFLSLCLVPAAISGQTNKGGISGTVKDSSGGVIPGATVVITNIGTNAKVELVTSESGVYAAASLDPVEYRVAVELSGFKKAVVDHVKVDTATTATVDVTLAPGALESEVTVTADAPVLNMRSGTIGQTITERQLTDVPLNNRSVLDLALIAPNVSGEAGSEDPGVTSGATVPGFNLSLNGARPGSTAMLADGVNNTGVGLARAVVSFSPETVQEFTVQTSSYSAEFGQTGGGVINVTTKSGTNRLSGTGLWYHRDPATNAAPFTTSITNRAPNNLRTDQVSVAFGGPVVLPKYDGHDRTFFFFAVEPRTRRDFLQETTLLPTDAMRGGDFSNMSRVANGWAPADVVARFGVQVTGPSTIYQQFNLVGNQLRPITLGTGQSYSPFPGNIIPQNMLDPTSLKALQFLPHAGEFFLNGNGDLVNSAVSRFVKQDEVRYTTRLDHALSSANHLSGRYTIVPAVGQRGFGSDINGNGADYSYSQQFMLSDTHTFTSNLLNDLRINYTRGTFSADYTPEFAIKSGRNLNTELGLPSLTTGGMPLMEFLDGPNAFGYIGSAGSTNNYNVEQRYNISDILYWNRGGMSWKFGVDLTHELLDVIPFFGAAGGRYDFRVIQTSANGGTTSAQGGDSFASFLLGVPNRTSIRTTLIPYNYRWNAGAAFLQNDWKVRSNLTLNLGLRYSLQFPRTEKNNLQGVFLPELAKQFALPAPVTLADGTVVTSAMVPPFAYAGLGGRSKYIFPVQWLNFEPRFGFAWSPRSDTAVRGGYGLSHLTITGNNRLPNPDFGAFQDLSAVSGQVDPNFDMRLSSNPPLIVPLTPQQALQIPANGLVYLNSITIPGYAISPNTSIPYLQNWNVTISREVMRSTVVEAGYTGSKASNLYTPLININPRSFGYVDALVGLNVSTETAVPDPLGRTDVFGRTIGVSRGSLGSPFLGFNRLNIYYNAAASSIRHAGYISFNRRISSGLSVTANYTYSRSIDDASDASPDKNALATPATAGHVTFGAPLSADRALSTFDVPHSFASIFIYDLPFGRDRRFLDSGPAPLRWAVGDWTVSGLLRLASGYPFLPHIVDANSLSADQTHTIRPDLVPGVPLVNPLWNRNCPVGNQCEPYVNPAAFMRPLKGQLGDASRTMDVRGPIQRYIDLSFQKNFRAGASKRMLQFRVDLLNAFNRPNFRIDSGNTGDFMGAPVETAINATEYDMWAKFNGKPLSSTPEGQALMTQAQQIVVANRVSSGALPVDFFHVRLPQGFATTKQNSYDITSIDGYKLYRLRGAYNQGFGQLFAVQGTGGARYIQIGLKVYF
jgi:outer membrane receptor protein involved in Fe transport